MLPEISLNVLDIAENSTSAGASLVKLGIFVDTAADTLTFAIEDDGCGMSEEQIKRVTDPFYTTRTTRSVGLGIPFLKNEAEMTGGSFEIVSERGKGTLVKAVFGLSSIDRMPLGDISSTIHNLVIYHPETDFEYTYSYDEKSFTLDTRELKKVLGDIPFDVPEVSQYIKDFLVENKEETDNGAIL